MTECQGCGAWNDTSRALCVLCGTPLAATDEWDAAADLPPLPPLPDGGLATSMPDWLRDAPAVASQSPPRMRRTSPAQTSAPLGPRADPRTFLSDDDFPRWLRDLAARQQARSIAPSDVDSSAGTLRPAREGQEHFSWMSWPGAPPPQAELSAAPQPDTAPGTTAPTLPAMTLPAPTLPAMTDDDRPPAAIVAPRALAERRERGAWETLLLVMLFIGVVVAAIWALVSNGVFSPTL